MSTFQYQARDEASWSRRANQSSNTYIGVIKDEFNVFTAKKDENAIRILPPTWEKALHYGYDIWVHFGVGPERGTVLCLAKMKHQQCPVCEFQIKAEAEGREDAGDYKPTRRVMVWLVDMKAENKDDNPMVWTMPWTVDRDISKICKDRETGQLYQIDHPVSGRTVYFDRSGEKETTKYVGFQLAQRESAVEEAYLNVVFTNPLPTVLIWRTYDEIKLIFEGDVPQKEEAKPPAPTTSDRPTRSAPAEKPAPPAPKQTMTPVATPIAVTVPPPPKPVAPPPPKPAFVSEWTNTTCPACQKPQYTVENGVTCEDGHLQPNLPFPTTPPPPATSTGNGETKTIPIRATTDLSERAASLKQRFQTGKPQ